MSLDDYPKECAPEGMHFQLVEFNSRLK